MTWSSSVEYASGPAVAAPAAIREKPFTGLGRQFLRALGGTDAVPHRYLLLLRFSLLNVVAVAMVGVAAAQGWLGTVLAADEGGLVRGIVAVFIVGLVWSAQRTYQLSHQLNELQRFSNTPGAPAPAYVVNVTERPGDSRALLASSLKLKLANRIAPIRHIANSLVLLGLIGTVIGFIIALSGVSPEVASDVNAIGPMVATLITGMSVALYTTLIGSILHLWLMMNVRLLEGGTIKLLTATIQLGEDHARP
ncbi:MAG: MotA/TolQ/ExbB proton channel family protein [Geminicoccaceae bacterium]